MEPLTPSQIDAMSPVQHLMRQLESITIKRDRCLAEIIEHKNLAAASSTRAEELDVAIADLRMAIGTLDLQKRHIILGIDPARDKDNVTVGIYGPGQTVKIANLDSQAEMNDKARDMLDAMANISIRTNENGKIIGYGFTGTAPAKQEAPGVTMADIEAQISSELFFTIGAAATALGVPSTNQADRVTVHVLTMKNGWVSVGINEGPVDDRNFDAALGRKYARENAIDKLWPVLGYALKEKMAKAQPAEAPLPTEPPPDQIQVGDVVSLKSGGIDMTVTATEDDCCSVRFFWEGAMVRDSVKIAAVKKITK